jgi:hypothetical protein
MLEWGNLTQAQPNGLDQNEKLEWWSSGAMECWVNADNSITPLLQYSNSPPALEIHLVCAMRFALCA